MRKTPRIDATGKYTVRDPWTISASEMYRCIAIRTFSDIYEAGGDVYKQFYEPYEIDQATFENDKLEGAAIVTLLSSSNNYIYIPDTYILSFPNMGSVPYNRMIVSLDLGALPDSKNLTALLNNVAAACIETIGVTPEVKLHVGASTGAISQTEHATLEANRKAALEAIVTKPMSLMAKFKRQVAINQDLNNRIDTLERLIISKNMATPP